MATYDDPRILRAIAHPTRNRVLHELHAAGSLRAADIAARLGIPANQASFHLRQLAKYGLVEEDPEAARDKRDRVWRESDDGGVRFSTEDMVAQPGGEAAYDVFRRYAVAHGRELVERAYAVPEGESGKRGITEVSLRLAPQEAEKLQEELLEVVDRFRALGKGGDAADGRETYSVYQLVQPFPDAEPASGE